MGETDDNAPPPWAQTIIEGQQHTQRAVDDVAQGQKSHSEKLETLSGEVEDVNKSVSEMTLDLNTLQTNVGHLKERATEDRSAAEKRATDREKRADKKESEIEGKVGTAHANNQKTDAALGELRGAHDNHVKDNHATVSAETKTALAAHVIDDNRHAGEAPGNGKHLKTAGLAAGGGGIIWVALEVVKAFLSTGG